MALESSHTPWKDVLRLAFRGQVLFELFYGANNLPSGLLAIADLAKL
jgi:hypothetical protein